MDHCYRPPEKAVNRKRNRLSRLQYSILMACVFLAAQVHAADVFTDRFDYPPEDTVIITGTGFWDSETVMVQISHLDGNTPATEDYVPWNVIANNYGIFETSWIVPWDALGKTLLVTAEGQSSGLTASTTFQDNNTILVLGTMLPDTLCPAPIEFCVTLYEQCTGGGFVPLPGRPILFFINDQNCGVDVGQDALDTVLTDSSGEACFYPDLSSYSGYITIRAKFLGEDKPGSGDPPNSACDPTRRVQLAASNYCEDYIVDSSACNEPPVVTCPGDTTIFLCTLQEICLSGFNCFDPDGDLESCDISMGYWNGSDVCFTPTGAGVYTLTLIATDSAGLADTCETNVTITLNSPPEVSCPSDTTLFVCNLLPICIPGFTVYDVDDNIDTLYVEGCELYGDTVCFNPVEGIREIVFIAVDECGQADTCITYVTVDLNANPVCNLPPNDTFFVCGDTTFEFVVSAYDEDGNLDSCYKQYGPGTYTGTVWAFSTTGPGVYTAGFQCYDACGSHCEGTVSITVLYNEAPVITCPDNTTVSCTESTHPDNTGWATVTDDNDPSPEIVYSDSESPGSCPQEKTITRTWVATDTCGFADTCVQTINVVDNTPPVVSCPANTSVECNESTHPDNTGYATADDNCDEMPDITYFDETTTGTCPDEYTITRSWVAVDDCGNADTCQQTINVVDTTPPVVSCPANTTVECNESTDPANTGTATATDNCDETPDITYFDETTPGTCPDEYTITRSWVAVDDCGNADTCQQTINVVDTTPPIISCPDNITVECNASTHPDNTGWATATDNCDPDPVITYSDSNGGGAITRMWVATDRCGNADTCYQTINIDDTTPPVASCPANTTVECNESIHPDNTGYATADDNCDETPDITYFDETTAGSCPDEYTITRSWVATDDAGFADTCVQTINVVDNTPPVVSCPANTSVECNESTDPANTGTATATDNCDETPDITYFDETTPGTCPDEYTITRSWVAVDDCGNADTCQQTINVVDTTPPAVSCPANTTVECDESTDPANTGTATADDNCDEAPDITYFDETTPGTCPDEYTITRSWVAVDDCGNADTCQQTINVVDTTPPVISCPDNITVECNASTHPDNTGWATATDNCDSDPVITYSDSNGGGAITRMWVATDRCGNADTCYQTINIDDTTPPVASCPANTTVECNESVDPTNTGTATADDNCDETPDITYFDETTAGSCPDEYTITRSWVATDDAGFADTCVQTITVVDTTPPIIIDCPPETTLVCNQSTDPDSLGWPIAEDNCDPEPEFSYEDSLNDTAIVREWIVTDNCGNSDTCHQFINIVSNNPPTASCPDIDTLFMCVLNDTCLSGFSCNDYDNNLADCEAVGGEFIAGDVCFTPVEGLNTLKLIATDECGLSDTCEIEFVVILNSKPNANCASSGETIFLCNRETVCVQGFSCDDPDGNLADCQGIGGIYDDGAGTICFLPTEGENEIGLIAIDSCGLADTCYTTVNVELNSSPVAQCPGEMITIEQATFPASITIPGFSCSDPDGNLMSCLASVDPDPEDSVVFSGDSIYFTAHSEGYYTINLTAVDECNELSICQTVVFVKAISACPIVRIEKTHNTIQGHYEFVTITIDNSPYEMGGFDFLISYDASALTAIDIVKAQLLEDCGWEYFTYRFGFQGNCGSGCPSGLLRIVAMAESNNGPYHPLCNGPLDTGEYALAEIKFYVTNDRNFECQYIPIGFFWNDCGDNIISSVDGMIAYISSKVYSFNGVLIWDEEDETQFPEENRIPFVGTPDYCINPEPGKPYPVRCIEFVFGGIDIICADSIDERGDINLNGVVNEVADAVVFTNYFIFGLDAFTINVEGQTAASDVNADGVTLSVADLVYLIRIIVGDAMPMPKVAPERPAKFASQYGIINVDVDLGAVYIVLEGDAKAIPGNGALQMDMISRFDGINTKVLIYSFQKGKTFTGEILVSDAQIVSVEAADYYGNKYIPELLPQEFSVRSYPNPFNPMATIELTLPVAAEWNLTIYNVTGQKVTDFDGFGEAGTVRINWDASGHASGIYFYKVNAGGFTATNKMILVK